MNEQSGRITVTSMMFAPRMLPTDIDVCFFTIAVIAVTSSGSDVPIATIVTAITRSDTPRIFASSVPLSTSSREPTTRHAAPSTKMPTFFQSVFLLLSTVTASAAPFRLSAFAVWTFSMMYATNSSSTITASTTVN